MVLDTRCIPAAELSPTTRCFPSVTIDGHASAVRFAASSASLAEKRLFLSQITQASITVRDFIKLSRPVYTEALSQYGSSLSQREDIPDFCRNTGNILFYWLNPRDTVRQYKGKCP
eukprot:g62662.t1